VPEVFRAHEQRIYRRADCRPEITHEEKDQMQQLIDLHVFETAPMWDGLGEAIQTNLSGEVARIAHELVGCGAYWGVEAFTRPLRRLERLDHADDVSGAHALLIDVRQRFPRVHSAFTQLVQTRPISNS
jgi:hypothetical protein